MMLCKIQSFILDAGQLFHIQISTFQNRVCEIHCKSMVVYLALNIIVHLVDQKGI